MNTSDRNLNNAMNSGHAPHPLYPSSDRQPVNLPLPEDAPTQKPFRVELYRTDERGGKFTPAARLIVMQALRTSGFLRDLPDDEAKTLLLLITFLRSDGRCEVSTLEVAKALDTAPAKARARLDRLAAVKYGNQPIVHIRRRDSGLDGYVLSAALVEECQTLPNADGANEADRLELTDNLPAGRAKVIAHSRALYANPRTEVEATILTQQLGRAPTVPQAHDASTLAGAARQAMLQIGLPSEQIDLLITAFPIEKITEQIAWLSHRHPKDPAKLLVSAIRYDYEPPAFIRLQQALEAKEADEGTDNISSEPEQAEQGVPE